MLEPVSVSPPKGRARPEHGRASDLSPPRLYEMEKQKTNEDKVRSQYQEEAEQRQLLAFRRVEELAESQRLESERLGQEREYEEKKRRRLESERRLRQERIEYEDREWRLRSERLRQEKTEYEERKRIEYAERARRRREKEAFQSEQARRRRELAKTPFPRQPKQTMDDRGDEYIRAAIAEANQRHFDRTLEGHLITAKCIVGPSGAGLRSRAKRYPG